MGWSAAPSPERCCTSDGGGRLSAGVSSLPRSVVGCGGVLWDCLAVQCFRCAACDGAGEWAIGAVESAGMPDFTFGRMTYLASARFCEPSNPLPEQGSPLKGTAHMGTGHGKGVRGNCTETEGKTRLVDG